MQSLVTCLVAGSQYLLHPQILGTIEETINPEAIVPVTLLTTTEIYNNVDQLLLLYDMFDDVFVPEFGSILVEKPGRDHGSHTSDEAVSDNTYHLESMMAALPSLDLPSGPYFLYGPNLHQAWKLYDDDLDAFAFGVIPDNVTEPRSFQDLSSLSLSGLHKAVGVPSKLYHPPPNHDKPLSGIRVSVPDTVPLKDVRTSFSSRSWELSHDSPEISTAPFAQRLQDLGAVIVGKTKVSQFSAGKQWVDVSAPWSPRADGYQTTYGNSAGAGAAIGGYDWLQHAIGHDVIGEGQASAITQGIYDLRTSRGAISLEDVYTSSRQYDTVSLSARNIMDLQSITAAALDVHRDDFSLPRRLVYLEDLMPSLSSSQQDMAEQFLATLENLLGVKAEPVNLTKLWEDDPPVEANGTTLQAYMQEAPFRTLCHDYYHSFKGYCNESQESSRGRPFVESEPEFRWSIGRNTTEQAHFQYLARIKVFRKWFGDKVMSAESQDDQDSVVILPPETTTALYRDQTPDPPSPSLGVTPQLLSPILGMPQLVAPFAQEPYTSRISNTKEYRPIMGSLMGSKNSEAMLINLVRQSFELAQWRTRVDTGRYVFPLGDNERNVDDCSVPEAEASTPMPSGITSSQQKPAPQQVQLSEEL